MPITTSEFLFVILIPFAFTTPFTLTPPAPEFVILTESVIFDIFAALPTLTPSIPVLEILTSPFEFSSEPAILTPVPVLSIDKSPFLFIKDPETSTEPPEFTTNVLPLPFEIIPLTSIPFEPEFVISTLPAPKFFI